MANARTKRPRGRPRDEDLAQRRREEILEVATRLFAARGFPAMDVQDVADALGVGKGTVYRYFPTKRELFLAAADRAMRLLKEHIDAAAEGADDALAQIEAPVEAYLGFFAARPEFAELFIQERAEFKDRKKPTYFVHREANIGRWEQRLQALIDAGVVRDLPVQQITDVLGDLLYGAMFTNLFAGRRRDPAAQARELLDVVLHGVLTPAGQRRRAARRRSGS
jgi:AcrR family transcriptional regulator